MSMEQIMFMMLSDQSRANVDPSRCCFFLARKFSHRGKNVLCVHLRRPTEDASKVEARQRIAYNDADEEEEKMCSMISISEGKALRFIIGHKWQGG